MHIAIIGAGAAGLAAAWDLVQAGHQVTILEAADQVGGVAAGFRLPEWEWPLERFYHHWFASDVDILRLIDEMGCADKLVFHRPQSRTWIKNRLYDLSRPHRLLGLPLSPPSKGRFALAGLVLKLPFRWQMLDHIPASPWLRRTMGREVYEAFWATILDSKFGAAHDIPLSWVWAHIYNRSAQIATYEGSFQALWEAFADCLRERGVTIHLNTPIHTISIQAGQPTVCFEDETRAFDGIISTLSPTAMLRITPTLSETPYAKQVMALKSVGAVCLVLALRQPLFADGTFSVTLPSDRITAQGFPFINLYEHTKLVSPQHYGGDHIVYCVDFAPPDQVFARSDEQIMARFTGALPRLMPSFSPDNIRQWWVFRTVDGQPIPTLNAGAAMPSLKTPLPGLYWVTINQMHPWGKGTSFAVRLGREAAKMLSANL